MSVSERRAVVESRQVLEEGSDRGGHIGHPPSTFAGSGSREFSTRFVSLAAPKRTAATVAAAARARKCLAISKVVAENREETDSRTHNLPPWRIVVRLRRANAGVLPRSLSLPSACARALAPSD